MRRMATMGCLAWGLLGFDGLAGVFVLTDPAYSRAERVFGLVAAVTGIGACCLTPRSPRDGRLHLGYPAAFLLLAVAGLVAWASSGFTNTGRLLVGTAGLTLFLGCLLWVLVPIPYRARHRLVRLLGIVLMASAPAVILLVVVGAWVGGTPAYAWRYGAAGTARLPARCHYIQITQYTGKRMKPDIWCPHATWYGKGGAARDVTLYLDVHEYQAIDDGISPTTIPARSLGGRAVTVERGDRPSVAIIGHIPHRWLFGGGASLLGVLGLFVVDTGRGRPPGTVPVEGRSRPTRPSRPTRTRPVAVAVYALSAAFAGSIVVAQHATFAAPEVTVRTTPPPAPHVSLTGTALSACDLLSDGSIRAVFPRARIVSRAVTRYAGSTFVPANGRCRIGLWLPHGDTGDRRGPLVARIEVTVDAIGDVATAKSRFAALALPRPWPRNLGADSCAQDGNALYCLRRDLLFHLAMDTVRPVNLHGRTTTGDSPFLDDTVVPVFARTVLAGTA